MARGPRDNLIGAPLGGYAMGHRVEGGHSPSTFPGCLRPDAPEERVIVFAIIFSDSSWWQVFYDDGNEYLVVYREGTFSITSLADRSIAPQVTLNLEPCTLNPEP